MRNPRISSRPKTPCQIEKFTTPAVDKFTAKFTAPTAYHVNSENGFFCTPKIHDSLARPLRDYIYMCDAPEKEKCTGRGGGRLFGSIWAQDRRIIGLFGPERKRQSNLKKNFLKHLRALDKHWRRTAGKKMARKHEKAWRQTASGQASRAKKNNKSYQKRAQAQ